ncbi:MAG: YkvA family protein [Firmicutes bacterium]|nr:YkvA family protein [Bacillota bacterium]
MVPVGALKQRAEELKINLYAVYLAYKDPRVPWHARVFAACVVGYAFSPIDLIPDFIPVLGYLDDLVLIPLGVAATLKMIPPQVLAEYRQKAQAALGQGKPKNWVAAGVIVTVWLLLAALVVILILRAV